MDSYFKEVTNIKPIAIIYLDDRAINFNGNYNKTALGQLGSDIAELFGNEVPAEVTSAYNTLAKSINGGDASKTVFSALDDFKRTLVYKCKEIGLNVDLSLGYSIDQNGHFVYEATDALGVYSGKFQTVMFFPMQLEKQKYHNRQEG